MTFNRVNLTPYSSTRSVAPTITPVSLAELKDYLRIVDGTEDAELEFMLKQAVDELEAATRRAFINQTWVVKYDQWPLSTAYNMTLPVNPAVSITSIQYVDTAGSTQTWSSANYTLDSTSEPARIEVAYTGSVPSNRDQNNSITVTYVAGYGATVATVPAAAAQWIKYRCDVSYCRRPLEDLDRRHLASLEALLTYGL